jgi:hypothetical protein
VIAAAQSANPSPQRGPLPAFGGLSPLRRRGGKGQICGRQ